MTLSQFLTIRGALVSAGILTDTASRSQSHPRAALGVIIERDLAKAKNVQETRYVRRMAGKIDAGLRTLDSIEGERTDAPQPKQQLAFQNAEVSQ